MIKVYLSKVHNGYKVLVSGKIYKIKYNEDLKIKPHKCIGYILQKNNSFFRKKNVILIDFAQLNYWLINGVHFSKSFLRFIFLLENYLLYNKYEKRR